MEQKKIDRINELARKSREFGLTAADRVARGVYCGLPPEPASTARQHRGRRRAGQPEAAENEGRATAIVAERKMKWHTGRTGNFVACPSPIRIFNSSDHSILSDQKL